MFRFVVLGNYLFAVGFSVAGRHAFSKPALKYISMAGVEIALHLSVTAGTPNFRVLCCFTQIFVYVENDYNKNAYLT